MRRRLQATYLSLLVAVLLGLDIPLAFTLASGTNQAMFIDRLNDTGRFASLAEPALRTGRIVTLEAEIRQYDEVHGIAVVVISRNGQPVLASRGGVDLATGQVREQLDAALSGRHDGPSAAVWPWHQDPMVVAVPVGSGGEVTGAVLTVSPTGALRTAILRDLAWLAAASLFVLLVGGAAASPLARWMLRPVRRLEDASAALADGRHHRVDSSAGPPELRQLADSFNRMASRITVLLERQRTFVSYASHQLRTPLATLQLCAENLRPQVRPEGAADLLLVTEEITRLGQLCDSLLSYARAEVTAAGGELVDAVSVTRRRIAGWRPVTRRAGIEVQFTADRPAPVRVAVRALDQALDAALSNAVKFAGDGATVSVRVAGVDDGWVEIQIADDGPGIAPADLDRAVTPFWRGRGTQQVDGSGLGLTIAEAMIGASGGQFELRTAVPHGVVAVIRLPLAGAGQAGHGDG